MYYPSKTQQDTLVKPDVVYKCLSDIVCKNGKFSSGSLVMIQYSCLESKLFDIADFVSISRNSINAEGSCYGFSRADTKCTDTFMCEPSDFCKYFEEAVDINERIENNSRRVSKLFDIFAIGHGVAALVILIAGIVAFCMFGFSEQLWLTLALVVIACVVSLAIAFKSISLYEHRLKKRLYESLAE